MVPKLVPGMVCEKIELVKIRKGINGFLSEDVKADDDELFLIINAKIFVQDFYVSKKFIIVFMSDCN